MSFTFVMSQWCVIVKSTMWAFTYRNRILMSWAPFMLSWTIVTRGRTADIPQISTLIACNSDHLPHSYWFITSLKLFQEVLWEMFCLQVSIELGSFVRHKIFVKLRYLSIFMRFETCRWQEFTICNLKENFGCRYNVIWRLWCNTRAA